MSVKEEQGDNAIEIVDSEDGKMVWVKGLWKGRLSKSKKGNWNQSWHDKTMFKKAVQRYLSGKTNQREPEGNGEDAPF